MKNNILIVCASDIEDTQLIKYASISNYIIAVDRGYDNLRKNNIKPNLLIGDFDSTTYDISNIVDIRVLRFPSEKNETDLELGVMEAVKLDADNIYILGATGRRLDHFFGNISSLIHTLDTDVNAYIIDKFNVIYMKNKGFDIYKNKKYVSFFPYSDEIEALNLRGFKYELSDRNVRNNSTLLISNEIVGDKARVDFKNGILLVIESED